MGRWEEKEENRVWKALSFLIAGRIPRIRYWRLFKGFISKTGMRCVRRHRW